MSRIFDEKLIKKIMIFFELLPFFKILEPEIFATMIFWNEISS